MRPATKEVDATAQFESLRNIIVGKQDFVHEHEYMTFQREVLSKLEALEAQLNDQLNFESQLLNSKDRIIDLIVPKMGKIIRTSISLQIEKINERIKETSTRVSDLLNPMVIINKMRGRKKTYYPDYPNIVQLFVIERDTGLLMGKFEKQRLKDPDMMTGLLTSIKTFAESTLNIPDAEVGMIDYGDNFIKLFNYGSYYFALVFSGKQNTDFETFIYAEIDGFANSYMHLLIDSEREQSVLDHELSSYFEHTCEKLGKR